MFESALVAHAGGVHLLAPPQLYEDIRLVTPRGVQKTLTLARDAFPFTVVDLEDCYHEEQVTVLRQADAVLLVFRLDFTSLCSTRRILDYLEQAGVAGDRVRLVINRYGQAKELPLSEAEEALGHKIGHLVPDDPKTINAANNAGVPAVFRAPSPVWRRASSSWPAASAAAIPPSRRESSRRCGASTAGWPPSTAERS
jgi:pilus assembly protein CpaE